MQNTNNLNNPVNQPTHKQISIDRGNKARDFAQKIGINNEDCNIWIGFVHEVHTHEMEEIKAAMQYAKKQDVDVLKVIEQIERGGWHIAEEAGIAANEGHINNTDSNTDDHQELPVKMLGAVMEENVSDAI